MKNILALLVLSASVFAQGTYQDPETMFKKVDIKLESLITRDYIVDVNDSTLEQLQQEYSTNYSDGELESVRHSAPVDEVHAFRCKKDANGQVSQWSEYDSGGQLLKVWKYERAADESFKVTEIGKTDTVVWNYDLAGKLLDAEYRSENDVAYKRLVNTYENGLLIVSEDRDVKEGKEILFRKTVFVYHKNGKVSGAKTYRPDGTKSVSRSYNKEGDMTFSCLYNTKGGVVLYGQRIIKYEDDGRGKEKVGDSWTLYNQDGKAAMRGRSEYDRFYEE